MIHFVTVHFQTDRWVDIQLRQLTRHLKRPFQVHAAFTGLDAEPHRHKFATVLPNGDPSHAATLNRLASLVCAEADADDILVFIDSDAFPIAKIDYLFDQLAKFPLIAVRRDENLGDRQPHPSFCLTTVGLWREIGGDWEVDHPWTNKRGEAVHDTGGNLLKILEERNIRWKPLLRTNQANLHPLLFGIYDGAIYHQAAGSRKVLTRVDADQIRRRNPGLPRDLLSAQLDRRAARNALLSREVFADIARDVDFTRRFRRSLAERAVAKLRRSLRSIARPMARNTLSPN